MVLPNFLIIGAHKGGTTWLTNVLASHPDVFMPSYEVKFFEKHHFAQGLDRYQEHFKDVTHETAIGEKSPLYLCTNQNPNCQTYQRIHQSLPDIKLIAVLRDPVERAISHARHFMRQARFGSEISPLVSLDDLILNSQLGSRIIERGYYARQLEDYYTCFNPEQVMVIINEEDIAKDPKRLMENVCRFIGVDPDFEFPDIYAKIHDGSLSRTGVVLTSILPFMGRAIVKVDRHTLGQKFSLTVRQETRQALHETYREENEKLFALLGRRWSSWSLDQEQPAGVGALSK